MQSFIIKRYWRRKKCKRTKKFNSVQKKEIDEPYKTISFLKDKISKLTKQIKLKRYENDEDQKYIDILSGLYKKD